MISAGKTLAGDGVMSKRFVYVIAIALSARGALLVGVRP
jgi:hypothetical protein